MTERKAQVGPGGSGPTIELVTKKDPDRAIRQLCPPSSCTPSICMPMRGYEQKPIVLH